MKAWLAPFCTFSPPLLSTLHLLFSLTWVIIYNVEHSPYMYGYYYDSNTSSETSKPYVFYFFLPVLFSLCELYLFYFGPPRLRGPAFLHTWLLCADGTQINGVYFLTRACLTTTVWIICIPAEFVPTGFLGGWGVSMAHIGVYLLDVAMGVRMVKGMQMRRELKLGTWGDGEYHGMEPREGEKFEWVEEDSGDEGEGEGRGRGVRGRLLKIRETWGRGVKETVS